MNKLLTILTLLLAAPAAAQTLPTTDMILHLDAADLSAAGDGGAISGTWPDQSAAGNNATAVSGPLYDADGIGGQPAVNFASGGYFTLPTTFKPTEMDVYVVSYLATATASTAFCTDTWGSPANRGFRFGIQAGRNTLTQHGDGGGTTSADRPGRVGATGSAYLVPLTTDCIIHAGFRQTPYSDTSGVNGEDTVWISPGSTLSGTGNDVSYNASALGRVGGDATQGFAGRIAEVVVYDTIQVGRDRRQILKYLARKYGITIDAPRGDGVALMTVPQAGSYTSREHVFDEGHPRYTAISGDPDRLIGNAGRKAMLTRVYDGSEYRVIAHYDAVRNLVTHVSIDGGAWVTNRHDGIEESQVRHRGDNHNSIALEIDSGGVLHIIYDHHNHAAQYLQSNAALDTWTGPLGNSTSDLVGTNESSVSYMNMHSGRDGTLGYVWFRDGGAGDGDQYLYQWNGTDWDAGPATGTAGILINGQGSSPDENAYMMGGLQFDSQGRGWCAWFWDEENGEPTRHDICIMKLAANDSGWSELDGTAVTIPVVQGAASEPIAETIAQSSGLYQGMLAIDGEDLPHVAYIREDGSGDLQVFHLYSADGSTYTTEQVSAYASGKVFRETLSDVACLAKGKSIHILVRESTANTSSGRHELCRYTKIGGGSWTRTVVAEGPDWQYAGPVVDYDAWRTKGEIVLLTASDEESKYTAEDSLNLTGRSIGVTPGSNGRETINKIRQAIIAK